MVRLRIGSWIIESKISEVGTYEEVGNDTFRIVSEDGGSEVWVVSSFS